MVGVAGSGNTSQQYVRLRRGWNRRHGKLPNPKNVCGAGTAHRAGDPGSRKYRPTRTTAVPMMMPRTAANIHGDIPETARSFAASDAPRSARPSGVSTAEANQVMRTIAVIRLGPTKAHRH